MVISTRHLRECSLIDGMLGNTIMFCKGRTAELILGTTADRQMSLESLAIFRRSAHLRMVQAVRDGEPHVSLRHTEPKSLLSLPEHPFIPEDWFRELVLFDASGRDRPY